MLFNSYVFILLFLPLSLLFFFGLSPFRLVRGALLRLELASLFFYAYWNPLYLVLFLLSITVNYTIGKRLEQTESESKQAKLLLWLGISFNLLLLGYYKYADFILSSIAGVFSLPLPHLEIILPLAISFYSFTQLAYLVDAYRGQTKAYQYNFISYSLFISFFPHLIAGPIVRYNELLPQFNRLRNYLFCSKNFARGLTWFILGLFKKVAIADNISPWVSPVFSHVGDVSIIEAWIGVLAYTFQLYFDFSGYSDMAIGLGWMFNIDLPINFNSPYKALSIQDFWRRWHITLSNFLRDYLYIPLGGNRQGKTRQSLNLMITMLLGGLWHGAGWNFVIWGGWHGLLLVINNLWRNSKITLPSFVAWLITFLAVIAGWVLFRATNLQDGLQLLQTMVGMQPLVLPKAYHTILQPFEAFVSIEFKDWADLRYIPSIGAHSSLLILFGLLGVVVYLPNTQEWLAKFKPTVWVAGLVSVLGLFCLLSLNSVSEFLYFQF